jgi:opacity protein-like surface antigen
MILFRGGGMKKFCFISALLVLIVGFSLSSSFAAPYVSGNLAAVFVDDSNVKVGSGDDGKASFDTGTGVTLAVGNSYYEYRAEIEFAYRDNDVDEYRDSTSAIPGNGEVTTYSLMVNGYYDFMPENKFSPFIGGGIGYANVELESNKVGREDAHVFAYQVAGGGSLAVNENLKLDLQYRLFATNDPDFSGNTLKEAEYLTHNIMIGFRYSF